MDSYTNPLEFRDRYEEDYRRADSVRALLDRWPGWTEHAEKEILDIKNDYGPEWRRYQEVQDVLERLAGRGLIAVPDLQEVNAVRPGALAVFRDMVPPGWAAGLRVPYVVLCGPQFRGQELQEARKVPAGWYGMTTPTVVLAVPELGQWARGMLECAKRGWMEAERLVHVWGQPHERIPQVEFTPVLIATGRHANVKELQRMVDKDEMDRPTHLCGHRWALCSQLTMGQTLWVLGRLWAEGVRGMPQQLQQLCEMLNLEGYDVRWFK